MIALFSLIISATISIIIISTKKWHGSYSIDENIGLQKFHTQPTPRIGGISIFISFGIGCYFANKEQQHIALPIILAGLPAFLAGLIEDITKKVSPTYRLIATIFSGLLISILTKVSINNVNIPGLDFILQNLLISTLFTAFALGGIANAINIIDGFNGLVAGVSATITLGMIAICYQVGDFELMSVLIFYLGAIIGFGILNWPLGKIFLGDGGAYFVGFSLGWFAIIMANRNPQISIWTGLIICAYPVIEVLFSYYRKSKREGHHPTQPDKVHLHMLIYRRIAKPRFRKFPPNIKNGMTSIYIWSANILPVAWGVIFFKSAPALIIGLSITLTAYCCIYFRVSRFHWSTNRKSPSKITSSRP